MKARNLLAALAAAALTLSSAALAAAPAELAYEVDVKVAYNGEDFFWLLSWPTETPSILHDVAVFRDGQWVRVNSGGVVGSEDRFTIMVDQGTVAGFANLGCYASCHAPVRSLDTAVGGDALADHPAYGAIGRNDIRKYIAESRFGDLWWETAWDAVKPPEMLDDLRDQGVFLDMWHWRAARSHAMGFSDDQYVLEHRINDAGSGPNTSNFDAATGQPIRMFDPAKVGFAALRFDDLAGLTTADVYNLTTENSIAFDPDYAWQEGDVIPRLMIREPAGSRGAIRSDGHWVDGRWTIELQRAMDTGSPRDDIALAIGRTYNVAFGVFRDFTGARYHHVSYPLKLGVGTPGAQLTAVGFLGDRPDWDDIPWTTVPVFYPAQVTMDWLLSPEHVGYLEMRQDVASCAACHGATLEDVRWLSQGSIDETGE